ncbi:hypothetical protein GCM10007962_26480 [Yeosuana aromativorans]|uniref:Uncharacterized protein n=1 Tax=Yeosuana aromativorans TaxID=288019 RepID=A0A8J3BLG1_9FLAO|nr:DUF6168 family protein [Yeosuana aromativorans]GGK30868.1 hypothetical protein GCM10007962_26480 [Yeosuana aromativorans]
MSNPFISFTKKATAILAVAFCLHIIVLKAFQLPLFGNKIIAAYLINLGLVVLIFGLLYSLRNKQKNQLGFLFITGSILKFAVFFIVFYPGYKADDHITKLEFAAFFVPYALGLIVETISLVKWLNKID